MKLICVFVLWCVVHVRRLSWSTLTDDKKKRKIEEERIERKGGTTHLPLFVFFFLCLQVSRRPPPARGSREEANPFAPCSDGLQRWLVVLPLSKMKNVFYLQRLKRFLKIYFRFNNMFIKSCEIGLILKQIEKLIHEN